MSKTYNIKLSKDEIKMFEKWDEQDSISSWEKIKSERIKIYNAIE